MFNFFGFKRGKRINLIYNLISFQELKDVIYNDKNILIDVRTKSEYDTLHIVNAVNIPVSKLRFCESEYRNKEKIILYCSSGTRTKEAIGILNNMGYSNLYIWQYGALSNFPYKDMLKM